MWPNDRILLSGFNPTNSHQKAIHKVHNHFHERSSVGAVCYYFSTACIPDIERGWRNHVDWGVNKIFHSEPLHRMCGLNKGVVNHVGAIGLHSKPNKYDRDAHFEKRNKEMK